MRHSHPAHPRSISPGTWLLVGARKILSPLIFSLPVSDPLSRIRFCESDFQISGYTFAEYRLMMSSSTWGDPASLPDQTSRLDDGDLDLPVEHPWRPTAPFVSTAMSCAVEGCLAPKTGSWQDAGPLHFANTALRGAVIMEWLVADRMYRVFQVDWPELERKLAKVEGESSAPFISRDEGNAYFLTNFANTNSHVQSGRLGEDVNHGVVDQRKTMRNQSHKRIKTAYRKTLQRGAR